ncbi:MAG: transcription antitermination factor NusB [Dehalococcoidales bacterium]|jgi:N utilization substance protein B|nr:transcription antitermination factor NusB [Dehalococcoidales bacterium]MDP6449104.1 transcription antitermination factor NusB [Dehalococcoidales bacterium]MDP6576324.1 transcription antitermination factor NusB [Dehalococcoidales bacterium]MDP7415279.1 transcription antitermination factor NusB [Dehalococcoidales bacterium]|tara:strand:- start:432 stop:869 length:438 start_codon:yes stop_codon:yes gene_type:complete
MLDWVLEKIMTGMRRKARAMALQALYEVDSVGHGVGKVTERLLTEVEMPEGNSAFIRETVSQVLRNQKEIDVTIQKFATAWPVAQLPVIDRNIIRLAIFEILFDNRVSVKVAINEAVELAKKYGSDNSPKFVNGVLGSVSALTDR